MPQKTIDVSINEIYSKPPKKNYATNKTVVYHIDDIWSLDILDLKDYGPENNRGYVRKPGEKWKDIENHENVQLFESRFFFHKIMFFCFSLFLKKNVFFWNCFGKIKLNKVHWLVWRKIVFCEVKK